MSERRYLETDIPTRLDRLPWSRWHWRVVIALGVTWLLDGLEVTLVGAVANVLGEPDTLALTEAQIGAAVSAYLAGVFTYPLVLGRFFGVNAHDTGLFLLPFSFGNLMGPILLGPLFDRIGRRAMIAGTYSLTGILLALTGLAFARDIVTAPQLTALWCIVFFVASAAASSAYLTVSELFPVELRGMAIAVFYAIGTGAGGVLAPALFGALVGTGSRIGVLPGYLLGAGLMLLAGIVAALLALPAERRSLEEIAAMIDQRIVPEAPRA